MTPADLYTDVTSADPVLTPVPPQAIFSEQPYPHPSLLGLAVLTDGEFLFPPPATRLSKALVSPAARLTLHQRFKLYPAPEQMPR